MKQNWKIGERRNVVPGFTYVQLVKTEPEQGHHTTNMTKGYKDD